MAEKQVKHLSILLNDGTPVEVKLPRDHPEAIAVFGDREAKANGARSDHANGSSAAKRNDTGNGNDSGNSSSNVDRDSSASRPRVPNGNGESAPRIGKGSPTRPVSLPLSLATKIWNHDGGEKNPKELPPSLDRTIRTSTDPPEKKAAKGAIVHEAAMAPVASVGSAAHPTAGMCGRNLERNGTRMPGNCWGNKGKDESCVRIKGVIVRPKHVPLDDEDLDRSKIHYEVREESSVFRSFFINVMYRIVGLESRPGYHRFIILNIVVPYIV